MSYRVTQRSDRIGVVGCHTYRSKLWAIIVAWVFAGKGIHGDNYTTTVEEVD